MALRDRRVTARIHRGDDGDLHHEYIVDGVAYPSADALEDALDAA